MIDDRRESLLCESDPRLITILPLEWRVGSRAKGPWVGPLPFADIAQNKQVCEANAVDNQ